ncbi:DUF4304 domain-containing protein [Mycobacterium sp. 852014-52144_SCH5372336]|uniref:DUF4304 domain-containing protein n=1 Tax=Mycobacterium sp. 852014-52144_SCH5372336 TaxID=1834115 RepID=UPI000A493695|nr:DUF4304 domain-containing protein [Mycobacterium sp. 852014-52144_SCH5372336]
MVSADVGPFLRARGFGISDRSFKRERGRLYDMIHLQPDWHNGTMSWHGFFVNVGIGSFEVDAACPGYERVRHPLKGSLLQRRWEHLVPDLPYEVRFDRRTEMRQFAGAPCDGFDLGLVEIEQISTTEQLVRYAVDNNLLIEYDKTCRYLAAIDDIDADGLRDKAARLLRTSRPLVDLQPQHQRGCWALGGGTAEARIAAPDYLQRRA